MSALDDGSFDRLRDADARKAEAAMAIATAVFCAAISLAALLFLVLA